MQKAACLDISRERAFGPSSQAPSLLSSPFFPGTGGYHSLAGESQSGLTPRGILEQVTARPGAMVVEEGGARSWRGFEAEWLLWEEAGLGEPGAGLAPLVPPFPQCTPGGLHIDSLSVSKCVPWSVDGRGWTRPVSCCFSPILRGRAPTLGSLPTAWPAPSC